MKILRFGILIALASLMVGCLVTRDQVREGVKKSTITSEQTERADTQSRYQELDERVRDMNGRVEVIENSVNILNASKSGTDLENQSQRRQLEERLKIYEEAISKLEFKLLALEQKMASDSKPNAKSDKSGKKKSTWQTAEDEFKNKDWKAAIVAYEEYRKRNPKGKNYSDATYKIGISFQELGMRAEAKTFLTEVVERFPKSEAAKRARTRLKALN